MKKLKGILISIAFIVLFGHSSNAQNKLSIENYKPVFFNMQSLFSAGASGKIEADATQWLNYTTLLDEKEPKISITVQIASGKVPSGMELRVRADEYRGLGKGKNGHPAGEVIVTENPKVLIDNIGTCYTGAGINEGHQLHFSFIITDYAKIEPGLSSIYLQYTIVQ